MIEVRYKARLGNNLFQYSLGRILAEGLGFELHAAPLDGFPNTRQAVRGGRYDEPVQVLSGQSVDLDALLADASPRRIVLDGWFQRYEYYRPYRDAIRRWLAFDPAIAGPTSAPETVLNVRRTDYVQLGWALPFDYYAAALECLGPTTGPLWIVTDDASDPFFLRFRRPLRFFAGTAHEQLLMMSRARRLVLSQSTFSWWAAFLGQPEAVVCPVPGHGAWSGSGPTAEWTGGINLIERDRFICLESPDPYVPSRSEQAYQRERLRVRRVVQFANRRFNLGLPEPPP